MAKLPELNRRAYPITRVPRLDTRKQPSRSGRLFPSRRFSQTLHAVCQAPSPGNLNVSHLGGTKRN